ncbi:DUF4435 domain-containing protein [Microvirga sp. 17 mud 1-3]|uniref:DUF4435 domain-containing protein n=1 Tax=Microvirga sp. 17 mud 1-3 TaxID=2082949 RepID=UPI000D6D38DD|nr:DUF4435 domain-containing protein [Microvirga sp. 17 mud 1-3]AWM88639.1 hypothetical protein C4E04_19165 [Microvirga sp. 17 mud 1-3]
MTFSRSNLGIANQKHFFNVDIIVYTEGGDEERQEDVDDPGPTYDSLVWRSAWGCFRKDLKAKFRPVGSKTTALEYARKLERKEIRNIAVCLDRDYSDYYADKIPDQNVLYTYGYSWENDVITLDGLASMTLLLARVTEHDEVIPDLERIMERFERIGRIVGSIDVPLQAEGLPLQPKKKVGLLLKANQNIEPCFCRKQIAKRTNEIRKIRKSRLAETPVLGVEFNFWRNYHGKTLVEIVRRIVNFVARKNGRVGKLDGNSFELFLIREFDKRCKVLADNIVQHYKDSLNAVQIA